MRLTALILLALFCASCTSPRSWSYTSHERLQAEPIIDKKIAVVPFEERRPDENTNLMLLYLVPAIPFGPKSLERPEAETLHVASGPWHIKPAEDMAKSVAQELENARIAEESFFTFRAGDGDLVLRGAVARMPYRGGIISYGLSFYGPLLWILLPAGYYSNGLRVSLSLVDRESDKAVWEKTYENYMPTKVVWIYAVGSDFQYDRLFKDIMGHAINDLAVALGGEARIKDVATLRPLP